MDLNRKISYGFIYVDLEQRLTPLSLLDVEVAAMQTHDN